MSSVVLLLLAGVALAQPPLPPSAAAPAPPAPPIPPSATAPAMMSDTDVGDLSVARQALAEQRREIEDLKRQMADLRHDVDGRDVPPSRGGSSGGERVSYGSEIHVRPGEDVDDVSAYGDDIVVEGHVHGDAASFGGDVHVLPGGVVDGDAVSFGGEVDVDEGGVVHGNRAAIASDRAEATDTAIERWGIGTMLTSLYHRLIFVLSFAGAGVLVIGLVPNRVGRVAHALEVHPIRAATLGAFSIGFLGLATALFTITIIGIPIAMLLVALMAAAWMIGFVGLCQAIGDRLPFREKHHGRWLAFLVGTVLLSFLGALPLFGWLVVMIASVVGVGGALATRFGARSAA